MCNIWKLILFTKCSSYIMFQLFITLTKFISINTIY